MGGGKTEPKAEGAGNGKDDRSQSWGASKKDANGFKVYAKEQIKACKERAEKKQILFHCREEDGEGEQ
eukprot:10806586-Lingulodinium_polyedra.AAC.1